jgi:hypothetical protein
MTNEQIEIELKHLATKEQVEKLRVDLHKELGDFKADLMKTIWLTQLSTVGLILIGVGLLVHFVK